MDNESLITLFKVRLRELTDLYNSRDQSLTENEFYENHIVSDSVDEDFVTQELCEYLDTFYDKRVECETSGLSADEWFENDMDEILIELFPNATTNEKEYFKLIIAESIDEQSEEQVAALRACLKDVADISIKNEECDEN